MTLYTFCVTHHYPYKKTIARLLEQGIIKRNTQNAYYSESSYFDNSTKKFQVTKTNRLIVNSETSKLFFIVEEDHYIDGHINEFHNYDCFIWTLLSEQGEYFMSNLVKSLGLIKACHLTLIEDTIFPAGIEYLDYAGKHYCTQMKTVGYHHNDLLLSCSELDVLKGLAVMCFFNKRCAKKNNIFPIYKYADSKDIIVFNDDEGALCYAFSELIFPPYTEKERYKEFRESLSWIVAMNKRYEERYRRRDVNNKKVFHWTEEDSKRCAALKWWEIWYDYESGYNPEQQINPVDRLDEYGKLRPGQRAFAE